VSTRREVLAGAAASVVVPPATFRNVLSIGLGAEQTLAKSVVFTDGVRTARSLRDLQRLFAAHGSTEVYARIGTSRVLGERETSLARALERARLAKSLGLALDVEIGLWRTYGDLPDFAEYPQLTPPRPWNTMTVAEMVPIVRDFGALVASEILATRVTVNVWHLSGDERGIGGVTMPRLGPFGRETPYRPPDAIDPEIGRVDVAAFERLPEGDRAAWYERHLWPHTGRLWAALAAGVRSVQRGAHFTTHTGSGQRPAYEPALMIRFFQALADAGYEVDQPGACFFPSNAAEPADRMAAFKSTLEEACATLKRPFFIAEHAYPVRPFSIGEDWGHATPGYPLSPQGQAALTRDLVRWGSANGRIAGVRQWAPEACDGGWAPMSLFDLAGQTAAARPALDAVRQGLA
jgi:hypothetical protein